MSDDSHRIINPNASKIKRAIISVSDKTGIVEFAKALLTSGIEIFSTGGTLKTLVQSGVVAHSISDLTLFPEILDGRVKTLHPKIHGGLLALRDSKEHIKQVAENNLDYIDLVVVNLYPFEATVAKPDTELAEAIEQIDIGGPSMLRSAAKNFRFVTVLTDASDYADILNEIKQQGNTTEATRLRLAKKVFALTAKYDAAIANYLAPVELTASSELKSETKAEPTVEATENAEQRLDASFEIHLKKTLEMRYGENPHQKAALYAVTS
ncbi:MAG: hypothetical protein IAF08_02425, partial [Rhizobacter sp.]|nr:hypothetical protein [Chlorobiales bacterium]